MKGANKGIESLQELCYKRFNYLPSEILFVNNFPRTPISVRRRLVGWLVGLLYFPLHVQALFGALVFLVFYF